MEKKVIIFTGGFLETDKKFHDNYVDKNDYIIGVDHGSYYALQMDYTPNIVVGDLDSIDNKTLNKIRSKNIKIIKFDPQKDYTDTEIAIDHAMEINPNEIMIFGAVGDRWDHSLSNILLLKKCLDNGYNTRIINKKNEICLINNYIELIGYEGDTVSLIPISNAVKGVTTENLFYQLSNETLSLGTSRGISNVISKNTNKTANTNPTKKNSSDKITVKISIENGLLLIIKVL